MSTSRREFLKCASVAGVAAVAGSPRRARARAQTRAGQDVRMVQTPVLDIGYEEHGDRGGFPILLLHGFPYDVRSWDGVMPPLADAGYRVLVPYLRGYGPTRFRDSDAPRMAEQAAIAQDVIDFADALGLEQCALAGFDWGNRAACITAILHPERVRAQVAIGGYSVQNTVARGRPAPAAAEARLWYQWYFNTERGPGGARGESTGHLPALVGHVVARVGVYRRGVRPLGGLVRQSRLRRRRHPLLPAPPRERPWRGALPRGGTTAGRAVTDSRAGDRAARRGERVRPPVAGPIRGPGTVSRARRAPYRRGCGARSAGAAAGRGVGGTARAAGLAFSWDPV